MKRYIRQNTDASNDMNNDNLVKLLNDRGIETKLATYELKAQKYDRFEEGDRYIKKFTCPGDWLAYFSMNIHRVPNADSLVKYYGYSLDDIREFIERCPTVKDMNNYASKYWWGDGDDYIIYLKNLSTGDYLYGPEETEDEYDGEAW